ncbi:MAG: hypothetical protein ACRD0C_17830 [Acidimicrobiia bacterium]
MEIDLLYVPDCPHRSVARHHLDLALARTRLSAVVREREIHSGDEAARLGMRGSPTILIDGHDPFADSEEPAGLSCRLYRSETGVNGAPTVRQLADALGG